MYARILVAYDGSDSAPHVLEQALILVRSEQAALDIITVVPRYQGNLRMMGHTDMLESMVAQYRSALEQAREIAQAAGIRARIHLREGDAEIEIADAARELGADLIVVGKRARFFMDHMPIGLTAVSILRQSPADVLVVVGRKILHLDRLFLAHQASDSGNTAALRAASIAARYASFLIIGLTYELGFKALAIAHFEEAVQRQAKEDALKAEALVKEAGVRSVKTIIAPGEPWYKTLCEQAAAEGAGLIICGMGMCYGLSCLYPGAGAARLLRFSECPVLVVKGRHDDSL